MEAQSKEGPPPFLVPEQGAFQCSLNPASVILMSYQTVVLQNTTLGKGLIIDKLKAITNINVRRSCHVRFVFIGHFL